MPSSGNLPLRARERRPPAGAVGRTGGAGKRPRRISSWSLADPPVLPTAARSAVAGLARRKLPGYLLNSWPSCYPWQALRFSPMPGLAPHADARTAQRSFAADERRLARVSSIVERITSRAIAA